MAMTEEQAWAQLVRTAFPGTKGWVEIRGWEDPRPIWHIDVGNGVSFSGADKHAVAREFDVYWHSVLRLTGEIP